jgi:glutamyl-tRNA synthetase
MQNTNNNDRKVVTRFAPSPTGFIHTGNLHTGLFAWLWAKKSKGTFILRIEDTDKKREVDGAIDLIKKSLLWLGLNWDEGPDIGGPHSPYVQSERISKLEIYKRYAEKLIEKDYAYADPYSEIQIEEFRKQAEINKKPFLYREHRPDNPPKWQNGLPLRFKINNLKRTTWYDAVRGELSAGPEALDDFILIKSDGFPTYNFAHIVDDIEMGITHITRGQEFISSTPNYIAVYEALGAKQPVYVTVPHIMGDGGKKKLGKRDGAKSVLEYEKEGYLPEAMINFLALLGWNPGGDQEVFKLNELLDLFSLEKIQKSGAQFNEEKLDWMNKEHMKMLPENERNDKILKWLSRNEIVGKEAKLKDENFTKKIFPIIFDRISKWGDIDTMVADNELQYFFTTPEYKKEMLCWKNEQLENVKKHLQHILNVFENTLDENFDDIERIKSLVFDYATEQGRGQVLWPLRVALSGKEKSPDPFTLAYILGKKETLIRIKLALGKIQ